MSAAANVTARVLLLMCLVNITSPATYGQEDPAAASRPAEATGQQTDGLAWSPKARALYGTLTFSVLLLIAFLVGSYVLVRYGRAVARRSRREPTHTRYVDAWSNYRLTEDQVDAVGGNEPDDDPVDDQ